MARQSVRPGLRLPRVAAALALLCGVAAPAAAYTVSIGNAPRSVFLRVGDGGADTYYYSGGVPGSSSEVNTVSVAVPATALGDGTAQVMASDGNQLSSSYEGYAFCNAGEVYVGGFVRGGSANGTLTAFVPAALTNATGQSIPMGEISWTSSGNGDVGAQPIPGGTFSPGTQTLATFNRNTWRESCHRFRYANSVVPSAGTYTAQVTYTLSVP